MLRKLFPRAHADYEQCCCAPELEQFGVWLLDSGYSERNTCHHIRRLRYVFEHVDDAIPGQSVSTDTLINWFAFDGAPAYRVILNIGTRRAYQRFLAFQGRLTIAQAAPPARLACLEDYQLYLREVRGLSNSCISQHLCTVSGLLTHGLECNESLDALTSSDIDQFLAIKSMQLSRQSLQHTVAHLRAFLRYSFERNLLPERLDRIDTVKTYRGEKPPRAMPWPMVKQLLRSISRESKAGWRDYTILHLMAHYGLRPSEIAALTVDSIDMEAKLLRVDQRKTQSRLLLPLNDSTIHILQQYLESGHPASSRTPLFLKVRRPSGGITHYAVCDLFKKRLKQAGLSPEQYSSYSLRHAFAMRLLQQGVGVKAIGDVMGHRSLESTCVYLRLDVDALRTVALPVPPLARRGDGS